MSRISRGSFSGPSEFKVLGFQGFWVSEASWGSLSGATWSLRVSRCAGRIPGEKGTWPGCSFAKNYAVPTVILSMFLPSFANGGNQNYRKFTKKRVMPRCSGKAP